MKTMKLEKGERFLARWPNTQFYYWSTIVEPDGEKWKVQFDDGTIAVLKKDDLHDSLPADAANAVARVTRSSPTKQRKRPEETRKSPARKVRKLFILEENVTLDTKSRGVEGNYTLSDVREGIEESNLMAVVKDKESHDNLTGTTARARRSVSLPREKEIVTQSAADVRSSPFRRSVSVTNEIEDMTHGAADVRHSLFKRLVSVTKEIEDVTHGAADVPPSPFKRSVSVTKETEDETLSTAVVCPSPFKRSVSVTEETEDETHSAADVHLPPSKRSVSVTKETEDDAHTDTAGDPPSTSKRYSVAVHKESVTHGVSRYTESFLDANFRRRPIREGSTDATRYTESYLNRDFRRRLTMEEPIESAGHRPSIIKASDSLLTERKKLTDDMTRYTGSNLDRDFRRQRVKEATCGTADTYSSPLRRSFSATRENRSFTPGAAHSAKFTLEDYEKKYLTRYPVEFGGRCGSLLLILLLPLFIMSVFIFHLVPDPTKLDELFGKWLGLLAQVAVGIPLFLFLQAVLTIVQIGTVVTGPLTKLGIPNMRCNGIYAALFTLVLTLSACYFKKEAADIVVNVHSEAAIAAMLLGIMISLILYRRAGKVSLAYLNPYGSTGCIWYDFWMGREITPCIGKFNIKLILHRFSVIITIILNALIVAKAYSQGVEEDLLKLLMISMVLQSLYCVHFLYHEDIYLYSFLAISEGVGYMITVGFMTFPFILTFTTKAILDYRLKATVAELSVALCAYIIGYFLLESSSYRKTLSVKNRATSVWMMKVASKWIPGVQIRAFVGETIIYWAFAMIAGTTQPGLFIIPSALTFSVLSKAHREYTRSTAFSVSEISTRRK